MVGETIKIMVITVLTILGTSITMVATMDKEEKVKEKAKEKGKAREIKTVFPIVAMAIINQVTLFLLRGNI